MPCALSCPVPPPYPENRRIWNTLKQEMDQFGKHLSEDVKYEVDEDEHKPFEDAISAGSPDDKLTKVSQVSMRSDLVILFCC